MNKLKGKRIFIVEDNVVNLAVFATTLRKQGAIIIQDSRNLGTVNFLSEHLPIDLILMDLMLRRGISGYDVFDDIQTHPELKDIPVVAISALDPETQIPIAQEKGFAGFISKPISIVKFSDQLLTCMSGEKIWITSR